ncbi:DUF2306 domain-containing protein [Agromyces neolithicus]|uniref:DUF2306 domain-containing protein n=1 Tax=Agromyces neolithicus TaxID=269420 RepID=A0ABN2M5A9_9MICO
MTAPTHPPGRARTWKARIPSIVLIVLAIGIAAYAVPRYLTGNPDDSAVPLGPDPMLHYLVLTAHAAPAGLALILGPFQFITPLRTRFPRAHRVTGRIYMICIALGAMAGLVAATISVDGFSAQIAFYLLNLAWLYSLAQGFRHIRRGEVRLHRVWMIRNYALTFSAVTLRIFLVIGLMLRPTLGVEFTEIYSASVWASIFVNAVAAEYFIVTRIVTPALRRRRPQPSGPRGASVHVRVDQLDHPSAVEDLTVAGIHDPNR